MAYRNGIRLALGLALSTLAGVARAGELRQVPVSVNLTTRTASGALGTARQGNQQILGCSGILFPSAAGSETYLLCVAQADNGNWVVCSRAMLTTDHATLNTLNDDSYISFTWDAQGVCTSLEVRNYSYYPPRTP